MKKYLPILMFIILLPGFFAFAHPGRTDISGCHTCRTNCSSWGLSTGEYHCHNAKTVSQPIEPIKSTYGVNGTGYATPAPEYKQSVNTVKKTSVIAPVKKGVKITPTVTSGTATTTIIPIKKTSVITSINKAIKATSTTIPVKTEVKKVSFFDKFISWFK